MCADTPSNRRWLQRVDAALNTLYQDPQFLQIHMKYIPASEQANIQRAIAAAND
jgi:hypothetical protein